MYNLKLKLILKGLFLTTGVLLWSTIAVSSDAVKDKEDLFKKFDDALRYIYFPPSQERLDSCYVEKEERCIATYKRAIEAKDSLMSYGLETALDATLSAIGANCKGRKVTDNAVCNGAISFLYFFNSSEFDKKILAYFSTASSEVTQTVFETGSSYWMLNRPDKSVWIKFVNSSEALKKLNKEGYINRFNDDFKYTIPLDLIKNNTTQ